MDRCANPACSEPFRYFRSGRIYRIDRREIVRSPSSQRGTQRSEHFWLCGSCSPRFKVVLQPDDSIAVTEVSPGPVYVQSSPPQSPKAARSTVVPAISQKGRARENNNAVQGSSQPRGRAPRILVLDAELKTLGFIEQMLQDSGLGAISCTSVVEAISLVATGFFDTFIVIDRPTKSRAATTLSALAAARLYCKSCFSWSVETVRQRCTDFVEEMAAGKLLASHDEDGTTLLPSLDPGPVMQPTRGTTL
jgi:hypothetical protein